MANFETSIANGLGTVFPWVSLYRFAYENPTDKYISTKPNSYVSYFCSSLVRL